MLLSQYLWFPHQAFPWHPDIGTPNAEDHAIFRDLARCGSQQSFLDPENVGKFTRHNQFQTLLVHGFPIGVFEIGHRKLAGLTTVITIPLQGTNISPWYGIFEDDFPNFPRWDMLIHWRVSLHGVWEHLWIAVRFQHSVPPQRSWSCRRCILGRRFAFPWRAETGWRRCLFCCGLNLSHMFLSRIQTPCRPSDF